MRRAAKILALLLGAFVLLVAGSFALIESGEVVVLRGVPDDGHEFIARLWVVDLEGSAWIAKADPHRGRWDDRLRENPRIELTRGGAKDCREAIPGTDPEVRRALWERYQAKYRVPLYGSRMLGLLMGGGADMAEAERSGVVFRLDPCPTSG